MKRTTTVRLWELWDEIEAADPDVSTERLCQMVADRFNEEHPGARLEGWQVCGAMEHHPNSRPVKEAS